MDQVLHLQKLQDAHINTDFFPYCQIEDFIKLDSLKAVLNDFPVIEARGSVPPHRLTYGKYFQKLLDELYSVELRNLVSEKFDIDLSNSYPMLTVRGQTSIKDGRIHTDTPSKLMTLLLYLNEDWAESTGNLRLLKDGESLDNYFDEVIPTAGKLLVFKVTDNCWHGHHPFIGKRHTIQLNYVINENVVSKETKKHSLSYTFKKLTQFLKKSNT